MTKQKFVHADLSKSGPYRNLEKVEIGRCKDCNNYYQQGSTNHSFPEGRCDFPEIFMGIGESMGNVGPVGPEFGCVHWERKEV